MNKTELKGKWNQIKGDIKSTWGELTDDQIDQSEGDLEKITGMVQETYGKGVEEAKAEVDDFKRRHNVA